MASTDTPIASKALSRPLQSTSTLLACNREFTRTFSRLWDCCWAVRELLARLWLSQKVQKKSQNSKKQGFPYYFFLLIEGFGSGAGSRSIHPTNGSGSGSGRPKNMWIRWIRILIRNTDRNENTNVSILNLRIETKPKRFDVFQNLKWNVSIYSRNFGTKPKLFDVFQLFFCKSKTFLFIPKMLEPNQNFLMCSNLFLAKAKCYYLIPKFWDLKENVLVR